MTDAARLRRLARQNLAHALKSQIPAPLRRSRRGKAKMKAAIADYVRQGGEAPGGENSSK